MILPCRVYCILADQRTQYLFIVFGIGQTGFDSFFIFRRQRQSFHFHGAVYCLYDLFRFAHQLHYPFLTDIIPYFLAVINPVAQGIAGLVYRKPFSKAKKSPHCILYNEGYPSNLQFYRQNVSKRRFMCSWIYRLLEQWADDPFHSFYNDAKKLIFNIHMCMDD